MKKRVLPHKCILGHTWEIATYAGDGDYPDPLQRFCHECLQQGRIESAFVQVRSSPFVLEWFYLPCPSCLHTTIIPLLPGADMAFDPDACDIHVAQREKLYWFHLPMIWPKCHYCEKSLALPCKEILAYA